MKFKKTYDVKGEGYKVTTKRAQDVTETETVGLFCPMSKEIKVITTGNDEYDTATFLHEMGHAIMWESGFRQTSISIDMEELFVDNISRWIAKYFILRHRP